MPAEGPTPESKENAVPSGPVFFFGGNGFMVLTADRLALALARLREKQPVARLKG